MTKKIKKINIFLPSLEKGGVLNIFKNITRYLLNKNIFVSKFKNVYLNLDIRDPIDRSVLLFDFYEDRQI